MAIHTKHPVSAPPVAPVREKTSHLLLRGWCVFVLVLALGGTAWPLALGAPAAGVVTVASGLVSAVIWIISRPPFAGRRLPWAALAWPMRLMPLALYRRVAG